MVQHGFSSIHTFSSTQMTMLQIVPVISPEKILYQLMFFFKVNLQDQWDKLKPHLCSSYWNFLYCPFGLYSLDPHLPM